MICAKVQSSDTQVACQQRAQQKCAGRDTNNTPALLLSLQIYLVYDIVQPLLCLFVEFVTTRHLVIVCMRGNVFCRKQAVAQNQECRAGTMPSLW